MRREEGIRRLIYPLSAAGEERVDKRSVVGVSNRERAN